VNRALALLVSQSDHMNEVLSGAMTSFIVRLLGAVSQFGVTILIVRMYGADGYGIYALALSLVVISATIGRWGLDQSVLKFISLHAENEGLNSVKDIFVKALLVVITLSGMISLMLYLLAPWLSEAVFEEPVLIVLIQLMAMSIIPLSLLTLISESLRAMKKMAEHTVVQVLLLPLISIMLLFQFKAMGMDLRAAAYAFVFASIVSVGIAFQLWYRTVGSLRHNKSEDIAVSFRKLITTANPMAWVLIVSVIMSFAETLILGLFFSSKEVGVYAASLRLALIVNFFIVAFNSILAPKFAVLYHQNNFSQVQEMIKSSVIAMLLLTSPIFISFFLFPEYVLSVFGIEFSHEPEVLMILALGQLVNIFSGPLGMMLLMTGHEKQMQVNMFIYSFIGISLSFMIIPVFGVQGAAWSLTVSMFILNFLLVRSVRRVFSN
jgi:O-antigen/teichoic acid export membrane protein